MTYSSCVLLLAALAGCSFPELDYSPSGGSGGTGGTGAASNGGGGQTTNTGGAPNGGGGSGGEGGDGGITTTEGGGGGNSCVDSDGDDYLSMAAPVECEAIPPFVGKDRDCDDDDVQTHPGQATFFTEERSNGGWDYDCSTVIETEYVTSCGEVTCPGDWLTVAAGEPGCGDPGNVMQCPALTGCATPSDSGDDDFQGCH